ncbi:MAG TPA: hypothetical protein VGM62_19000 [Chthoniobacterales bacterium]|jgi:hypothetical protein
MNLSSEATRILNQWEVESVNELIRAALESDSQSLKDITVHVLGWAIDEATRQELVGENPLPANNPRTQGTAQVVDKIT